MKRILTVLFCFIIMSVTCAAQSRRYPSKSDLIRQNLELQARIDSLNAAIDSLRSAFSNTALAVEDSQENAAEERQYTHEEMDSLMQIWYQTTRNSRYVEVQNVDSVSFSSDVPDSILIQRLKDMNAYITLPFNETVRKYMIMYSEKMPTMMRRVLGLSEYYMPIFEEVFMKYDLPVELKYMAIIESCLNPTATSRAGARGIWQFMYRTANIYGLRIDSYVDERLDVEKAADAAARYLRDSYRVFGDWCLAISSYNCGAGNVQKAMRRSGSRDFWSLYPYLPRETRGYMPAFVGAMYAVTYAKEYGLYPDEVGRPAVTDTFHIRKNLHFQQITDVTGIPMDILKDYNPQYVHDIVPGASRTSVLKLPFNYSKPFMEADQDSLYLHRSAELLNPQVMKNIQESGSETRITYKVKNGDYLGRIATRHGVTVSQIMKWNHLRSSNLRVGQILYIYKKGYAPSSGTASKSSSNSSAKSSAPSSQAKKYETACTYTVKAGDTFYDISRNYPGVSAQNIMDHNGLKSSSLRPGMVLKIPKAD